MSTGEHPGKNRKILRRSVPWPAALSSVYMSVPVPHRNLTATGPEPYRFQNESRLKHGAVRYYTIAVR